MNSQTEPNHAANLFGGLMATVLHEDGSTESVKVRQLRVREYEIAWPLLEDEFAITAFCCLRSAAVPAAGTPPGCGTETIGDKNWILTLQPESYSELVSKARHVNEHGFFSYATRRQERERAGKLEMMQIMAEMPADTLKTFTEAAGSRSMPRSPAPRPTSK